MGKSEKKRNNQQKFDEIDAEIHLKKTSVKNIEHDRDGFTEKSEVAIKNWNIREIKADILEDVKDT